MLIYFLLRGEEKVKKNIKIKWDIKKAGLFFMLMVVAVSAQASMSGSGYPWESTIGEIT